MLYWFYMNFLLNIKLKNHSLEILVKKNIHGEWNVYFKKRRKWNIRKNETNYLYFLSKKRKKYISYHEIEHIYDKSEKDVLYVSTKLLEK